MTEETYHEIKDVIEGFDEKDRELIRKSYEFAKSAHAGQTRMSGEPYITHSIEVAKILKEMKMDAVTISAGLLHDVIEDTGSTPEKIKSIAGEEVAFLVEALTHVTAKVFQSKGEIFSDSLRKMFLAMANDIRIVIIKLADRLHNMRTIKYLPEDRRKIIADETLNIYAPLAHRFGMAKVKAELEDVAFSILNPAAYREIAIKISEKKEGRERRVIEIKSQVGKELETAGIKAEITGRPKHFYSIYQKMEKDNKSFEEIYDLLGIRVITDDVSKCYSAVGIIHKMWKPIPGRFKDYIAMPKSNMYQSLHTTVLDEKGKPIEFQIRTYDMEKGAEDGIAAHWSYKEQKPFDKETDTTFAWIRQVLEWQGNLKGADEFIKELKLDLFEEEVFVFTPKGEVKELVAGATLLDFAYSIHSNLGDTCAGGKVNGKWVNIKYQLKNGDIAEVVTSSTQHPTIDWLKAVKTTKAKNRIRHWLRTNQNMKENIEKGKDLIAGKLLKQDIKLDDVPKEIWLKIKENYNLKEDEDLLAAVGYGEFSEAKIANNIVNMITEKIKQTAPATDAQKKTVKGEIIVQGEYSDIAYRFAKCCNPVPGDDITGIFTKRGISIHRKNCQTLDSNKPIAPFVAVNWGDEVSSYFKSRIKITGKNREGLLNDVLNAVNHNSAFVTSLNSHAASDGSLTGELTLKVKSQAHVNEIMNLLRKVKDLSTVERIDV